MKITFEFNQRTNELISLLVKNGPEFVKKQFNREYAGLQKQKNLPDYKKRFNDLLDAYNDLTDINMLASFSSLVSGKNQTEILNNALDGQSDNCATYISSKAKDFDVKNVRRSLDGLINSYKAS